MKITGILKSVEIECSVATVTILANGYTHYFFAEPRLLVDAFERCWPDGNWRDRRVICTVDGPLLMSFEPAAED